MLNLQSILAVEDAYHDKARDGTLATVTHARRARGGGGGQPAGSDSCAHAPAISLHLTATRGVLLSGCILHVSRLAMCR
jgi:hypothetical protein